MKDRSKQLSKTTWKDPTRSLSRLAKVESKLVGLFRNYRRRVLAELKPAEHPFTQMEQHTQKWPTSFSIEHFYQRLEDLTMQELIGPANAILEKEIPDAFTHGTKYADLNLKAKMGIKLGAPLEERQRAWQKVGALVEKSKGEFKGVSDAVNQQIRRAVADGMVNEDSLSTVTKRIQEVAESVGENRARMIARTETMKAINTGVKERYARMGIERVEWLAAEDERTCFVKNTMVMTIEGERPIQQIVTGEMILTQHGYQRVTKTMKRDYLGGMVTIKTDVGEFTCTSNHPIYVIGKGWLRADNLCLTDTLQSFDEHPTKIRSINHILLSYPYNTPSLTNKIPVFGAILNWVLMPIRSVSFKSNLQTRDQEINRISPHSSLLNKFDSRGTKCSADGRFKRGLSLVLTIAGEAAETTRRIARYTSEFFATLMTDCNNWRSPAFFRTIRPSCGSAILPTINKHFSTPFTSNISTGGQPAFHRADCIPVCESGRNRKLLSANRTDFGNHFGFFRFEITRPTTIDPSLLNFRGVLHKILFTNRAYCGFFRVLGFMKTISGAILSTGIITLEYFAARGTCFSKSHQPILTTQTVYNLSVENDPVYYANGHLVHNCEVCGELDGQIFDIDKAPECPAHPLCRCTLTITEESLGLSEDEEEATQKETFEQITSGQGRFL